MGSASAAHLCTAAVIALLASDVARASQEVDDRFPLLNLFSSGNHSAAAESAIESETNSPQSFAPLAMGGAQSTSAGDIATVKRALEAAGKGRAEEASQIQSTISDPIARKLVEWALLRGQEHGLGFSRYANFVRSNPSWPSIGLIRRRAEAALWEDKADAATITAFFANSGPTSAKGRFALARVKLAQGDKAAAQQLVREAWRRESLSGDVEAQVLASFGELLTRADHKARLDRRLYADDSAAALRSAQRLGAAESAIARARLAVSAKSGSAGTLLDAVPGEVRSDPTYLFGRIQWLRRNDRVAEAAQLMASAPREPAALHDVDEWWVERRLLARKLLDADDARLAYRIARDAAVPAKDNYRAEHQFTAGWIALRFLKDPQTAARHFAQIGQGTLNPIALARASYWQARAAEAVGHNEEARRHYQSASRFRTSYYGQLARARLGETDIVLSRPPAPGPGQRNLEVVRALEILYAVDRRDLVIPLVADLGSRPGVDPGALASLAEVAGRNKDARAVLMIGKGALSRGLPFDHYAFPDIGIPQFSTIGPDVDRSVVYAIARQESAFNQKTVSSANALGLMQVTPQAGRYIAKKFGVGFDQKRLLSDAVYNTQMGAAEIGNLIEDYRGSYILAFAAYNAGRGRVRDWIQRYGDPRDANVDPVDWVERIPFAETRNYVQRVLENLQVYRVRLGRGTRLQIEADLRGSAKQ